VELDSDDPGRDLLGGVAEILGLEHPENLDFSRFKAAALAAARATNQSPTEVTRAAISVGLPKGQVLILQLLARALNDGVEELPMGEISSGTGIPPAHLLHNAQALHDRDLARIEYGMHENAMRLRPEGSAWLAENDLMPRSGLLP